MAEPSTWRELLEAIIEDPEERENVANAAGVNPVTLMRWVRNEGKPRLNNLIQLLNALPNQRSQLQNLMTCEFPEMPLAITNEEIEYQLENLSPEFYAQVFKAYTSVTRIQLFWSISRLIFRQALEQLDPNLQGMAVTIMQCTSPGKRQRIRSIRVRAGQGTAPWPYNIEQYRLFLRGSESFAGYVIATGHATVILNRRQQGSLPVQWEVNEQCIAAYPLNVGDTTAGCVIFSSTRPNYFLPFRQRLMEQYATLMLLAFMPNEFYPLKNINLYPMPYHHEQIKYLANFDQKVLDVMNRTRSNQQSISRIQAEEIVWQQVEEELIQQSANKKDESMTHSKKEQM